jgi:hypothetical protein
MLRRTKPDTKPLKFPDGGTLPSSDPTARLGEVARNLSVEAELEDLLSELSEAQGRPIYELWEVGTNPLPAINAGLASNRLELVERQPDWYEHPHYAGRFIRIQNGRIGPPGVAALPKKVERRILSEIAKKNMPMFFRGEFRLTEDEKHRRIFRSEIERQAALKSAPRKKVKPLVDEIERRFAAGEQPPGPMPWDRFCESVRDACKARKNNLGKPERGYGDRTIKDEVKRQRGAAVQKTDK